MGDPAPERGRAAVRANRVVPALAVLACAAVLCRTVPALAADADLCTAAIAAEGREAPMPVNLLATVALVESGRAVDGRVVPWPWAANVEGASRFFASKAEAVQAVQALQAAGTQSIDVGCMQINLRMHPHAFATLDEAFDPGANVHYGAAFLRALFAASGSWGVAITAYHSMTPGIAADYARRVLAVWPGAAAYGLSVPGPFPDAARTDRTAGRSHDYTSEFAAQVAAEMEAHNRRLATIGVSLVRAPLGAAVALPQHGPAWPRVP